MRLAATAAGLSLYATPQRALLHARMAEALQVGRERAVAGLAPAGRRYGPGSGSGPTTWPCSVPRPVPGPTAT